MFRTGSSCTWGWSWATEPCKEATVVARPACAAAVLLSIPIARVRSALTLAAVLASTARARFCSAERAPERMLAEAPVALISRTALLI